MSYRCIVIDDEKPGRDRVKRLLAAHPDFELAGEAADADAAVRLIDETTPDLCFLDVQMPEGTGFDVLERVRHVPHVIFVTAYDRYAVPAFEVRSIDYLLKPVGRERFAEALERARERIDAAGSARRILNELDALRRLVGGGGAAPPALDRVSVRRGSGVLLLRPRRDRLVRGGGHAGLRKDRGRAVPRRPHPVRARTPARGPVLSGAPEMSRQPRTHRRDPAGRRGRLDRVSGEWAPYPCPAVRPGGCARSTRGEPAVRGEPPRRAEAGGRKGARDPLARMGTSAREGRAAVPVRQGPRSNRGTTQPTWIATAHRKQRDPGQGAANQPSAVPDRWRAPNDRRSQSGCLQRREDDTIAPGGRHMARRATGLILTAALTAAPAPAGAQATEAGAVVTIRAARSARATSTRWARRSASTGGWPETWWRRPSACSSTGRSTGICSRRAGSSICAAPWGIPLG